MSRWRIDDGLRAGSLPTLRRAVVALRPVGDRCSGSSIYFRVNIMARVGQSVIYDLRAAPVRAPAAPLAVAFSAAYSVGRVITRVINDVGVLREFITWACWPLPAICSR